MILKVSESYIELLNKAAARELQVSVQYILQHTKMERLLRKVIPENILLDETTYDAIGKFLKTFAISEMKHLASIVERIYLLGGEASTKPSQIKIGSTLKEMMELDYKAEEEALELYREVIDESSKIGDKETWKMFTDIYSEEEEHLLKFHEYIDILPEPEMEETPESPWRSIFSQDYIDMLNRALFSEFSAIVQYTYQHEKANSEALRKKSTALEVITGQNKADVISKLLKKVFMDEMNHAEMIAERIFEIDREALANVDPIPQVGKDEQEFIKLDRKAENDAIVFYREIIKKASELGDIKTKTMFEDIIKEEEEHYWIFDDFMP